MEQQFDNDKPMCQDDYEYFSKSGRYSLSVAHVLRDEDMKQEFIWAYGWGYVRQPITNMTISWERDTRRYINVIWCLSYA